MKAHEIEVYPQAWQELRSGFPLISPKKVREKLGSSIVLNVIGGGCKTFASGSRMYGLRLIELPITNIFGTSAGCAMGAMYLDGTDPEHAMLSFAHQVNEVDKNFDPRKLLKRKRPFPHEQIYTHCLRSLGISAEILKRSKTQMHVIQVSKEKRAYTQTWVQAVSLYSIYSMMCRRRKKKSLNRLTEKFFDQKAACAHLELSKVLQFKTSVLNTHDLIESKDIVEQFMRSSCTPPFTKIRRSRQSKRSFTNYFDGGLTYNNMLPLIIEQEHKASTVITLLPTPRDRYVDGYLGIHGYQKQEHIHPDMLLCSAPSNSLLPPQHLLWSLPEQKMTTWDYTDPRGSLDLWTYGYRSIYHFTEALDISQN